MKKKDTSKVTGKDLLSSMSQFKEIHMQDYFRHSNTNFEDNPVESVDKSYLEVRKFFLILILLFNIFFHIYSIYFLLLRGNFCQYNQ